MSGQGMANADTQASLAHGSITPEFFEALITQTANRGQYLGILRAGFSPGQPWIIPPAEQLSKLTSQLKNINRNLSRRQASNKTAEVRDEQLKKLESQRDPLPRNIDDLAQQAASPTDADPGNTYSCDFLKITQTGRNDTQIETIIEQARRDIRALQKK